MRLIDADALKHELKVKRDYFDTSTAVERGKYFALNKAITMLDEQPTVDANHIADDGKKVDAVQVVRCRDCKYYDPTYVFGTVAPDACHCKLHGGFRKDDFYCASGVRK